MFRITKKKLYQIDSEKLKEDISKALASLSYSSAKTAYLGESFNPKQEPHRTETYDYGESFYPLYEGQAIFLLNHIRTHDLNEVCTN